MTNKNIQHTLKECAADPVAWSNLYHTVSSFYGGKDRDTVLGNIRAEMHKMKYSLYSVKKMEDIVRKDYEMSKGHRQSSRGNK